MRRRSARRLSDHPQPAKFSKVLGADQNHHDTRIYHRRGSTSRYVNKRWRCLSSAWLTLYDFNVAYFTFADIPPRSSLSGGFSSPIRRRKLQLIPNWRRTNVSLQRRCRGSFFKCATMEACSLPSKNRCYDVRHFRLLPPFKRSRSPGRYVPDAGFSINFKVN